MQKSFFARRTNNPFASLFLDNWEANRFSIYNNEKCLKRNEKAVKDNIIETNCDRVFNVPVAKIVNIDDLDEQNTIDTIRVLIRIKILRSKYIKILQA